MSHFFYAVTASPPTAVTHARTGSFTGTNDLNLVVAKGTRLIVYTWVRSAAREAAEKAGGAEAAGESAAAATDPLVETLELPINGQIVFLDLVRLGDSATKDSLVVVTERMQCLVLSCDEGQDGLIIRLLAKADLTETPARRADRTLVSIDPNGRCIAIHSTDGLMKLIPLNKHDGKLLPPVNHRIEEIEIIDMCFLADRARPTLVLLYIDTEDRRNIKSYEYDLGSNPQQLTGTDFVLPAVEDGASMLQPIPTGGVLIFGEASVMNFNGQRFSSLVFEDGLKIVRSAAMIDESRWLFGDQHGTLFVLALVPVRGSDRSISAGSLSELKYERLGTTSTVSALAYLSDGYVFVGSTFADSQLIRLRDVSAGKLEADASLVEVVTTYPNLGPITDLTVVGLQQQQQQQQSDLRLDEKVDGVGVISEFDLQEGQGQIVTCSGAFQDGTLRVVRSGIGIDGQLEAALPGGGIKSMWALKHPSKLSHGADPVTALYDDFLICGEAGAGATILGVAPGMDVDASAAGENGLVEPELSQADIGGFDLESRVLSCMSARVDGSGVLVQVTPDCVALCAGSSTLERVHEWQPPGSKIQAASANSAGQIAVACGNELKYLRILVKNGVFSIEEVAGHVFPYEIACVDITALSQEDQLFNPATICALGLWTDKSLRLLSLEPGVASPGQLHELCSIDLGEELHARSVLLQSFSVHTHAEYRTVDTVFVGMGDGHVIAYEVSDSVTDGKAAKKLENRRKVSLGTQPITLVSFLRTTAENPGDAEFAKRYVFVCGDRPTVIHSDSNGRLLFSNVNTKSVQSVCAFVTKEFGNCVALAQDNDEPDEEADEEEEGAGSLITIGGIDNIQKLHKQTVAKLGEGPRRLAHDPTTNTFCVAAVKIEQVDENAGALHPDSNTVADFIYVDEKSVSDILMIDGSTFDTLSSTRLRDFEIGSAVTTLMLSRPGVDGKLTQGQRVFAVGTAFERDNEAEPSEGRVMIYSPMRTDFLRPNTATPMMCSYEARGAVYSIAQLPSRPNTFVIAVNNLIRVCEVVFKSDSGDDVEIRQLCEHFGALVCLSVKTHGEFIVVGDIMRSISLLRFSTVVGDDAAQTTHFSLEEIGRDFYPNWMTAVAILDEDTYLGAENNCNLFVVHRNSGASTDEERGRLDTIGRFHLGEFVNVFCHGSLVMPSAAGAEEDVAPGKQHEDVPDVDSHPGRRALSEWNSAPIERRSTIVWGSVSGAVGLVCQLAPSAYAFLHEVEEAMRTVVQPYGHAHEEWRSFHAERLTAPAVAFIDGDLVEKYLTLGITDQRKVADILRCDSEALARRIDVIQRALH